MKKEINKLQVFFGVIPIISAWIFPITREILFLIISVMSMFLIVGTVPLFKKRESLWIFLLVSIAGIPVNFMIAYFIVTEEYFSVGFLIGNVFCVLLLSSILFSVEQIVFGIITRKIWKRQIKLFNE